MKITSIIRSVGFAVLCVAYCAVRADLVWTPDKGWQVQGGVLANVLGENINVQNALEAMNEGKTALDEGDYWAALGYYQIVVNDYPNSIFAPEAYYQMSQAFVKRGQFMDAFDALQEIVKKYPDYPRFNQIIGAEYDVAATIQSGATPYLWGWFPWFTNYNDAIKIYESVVKDAPYSDYSPIALMNISIIAEQEDKPDVAFDALDRLINNYPKSMFASDAYLQMAKVYRSLVQGPEYDQTPTRNAISFFNDYLILFPNESQVARAEEGLEAMEDTYARSRLVMGDFYYYYRNNGVAASIFYNETITLAPNSPAAKEAEAQLKKIREGIPAPMTPYDWIWGRYKPMSLSELEDDTHIEKLNSEAFEEMSVDQFLETPGAAVVEQVMPDGSVQSYEELAPMYGDGLGDYLFDDGFYQWTQSQIDNATDDVL